jgi:hypothetical protein
MPYESADQSGRSQVLDDEGVAGRRFDSSPNQRLLTMT